MRNFEGLDGGIGEDCGEGTIVWVRRRNGSWWPGRILGPNELSASHLLSPRSGTPVKLLGREDASVDWYNLEKSKRVKAFRCGEFDACIEKAEASQGTPIKKREKYARREDAILHALELEKQQQKLGIITNRNSNKTSGALKRELNSFSSEVYTRNGEPVNHKYKALSRRVDMSLKEENMSNSFYSRKGKNSKRYSWEGDIPEAVPRMRGLQDFGLRIAQSKRKLSQALAWDNSQNPDGNYGDVLPGAGHSTGGVSHVDTSRSSLAVKRKSSLDGISEDSLIKRRDKRRPLLQVLESSRKLPVSHSLLSDGAVDVQVQGVKDHMGLLCRAKRSRCIYLPADSNDSSDNLGHPFEPMEITETKFDMHSALDHSDSLAEENTSSGLIEANESDFSEMDYLEPDMEEEENLLPDTAQNLAPGSKRLGRLIRCAPSAFQVPEKGITNNDGIVSRYMIHPHERTEDTSGEVGVSKWHMKGKRNTRNITKRPMDAMDVNTSATSAGKCNGFVKGSAYDSKGRIFKMGGVESSSQRASEQGFYHKRDDFNYACDEDNLTDKGLDHTQPIGFGYHRYSLGSKAAKDCEKPHSSFNDFDNDSHVISPSEWETDGPSHVARRAYWEGSSDCFDPVYVGRVSDKMEPMLVDVDLKVQASYQGERVPLVSLMSRLNGKAIIGHPVQIEILEEGSTDLVSRNGAGLGESTARPPVWRTARRTAMQRVPRSHTGPSALEGEDTDPLQYSDLENKPPPVKANSGHSNLQAKLVNKSTSHSLRPMSKKFQRKHLKRVSLSSQKTRTLSSIATEQKLSGEKVGVKLANGYGILGGLIKPEGVVPPVTCVPVKVVFSRILEAVGRPSSAVAHRVLMTSLAVRDPT